MKRAIHIKGAPKPIGPYSQAIMNDNMLFVSGQIPVDPQTGELISGPVEEQTQQVMKNIGEILKTAGMSYSNVLKVSIFLKDLSDFTAVNKIYASYFKDIPPARETVQVAALPLNSDIEISLIAAN